MLTWNGPMPPHTFLPDTFLHGTRTPWQEAPEQVKAWVRDHVGSEIEPAQDQLGGMSTGVAAVVHGSEQKVFVKGVDTVDNPQGAAMYRVEAAIAGQLPKHPTIPELLAGGIVEVGDGSWWVTLLEARPGHTPDHPWRTADLDLVLAAWQQLQPALAATPWSRSAAVSELFVGWRAIADDPTDPWHQLAGRWRDREEQLAGEIDGGAAAQLSHIDLRADNILIDQGSKAVAFVDWAHPGTAAAWADVALLLGDVVASGADVEAGGEIDVVDRFATAHPDVDPELGIATISALAAFLHGRAHREQANPDLPHRRSWMLASSEQMLPFVTAHTH